MIEVYFFTRRKKEMGEVYFFYREENIWVSYSCILKLPKFNICHLSLFSGDKNRSCLEVVDERIEARQHNLPR